MTYKTEGVFNFAQIGDIHVGHNRTPTVHVVSSLHQAFPDDLETAKLDAIFITGDFFDRALNLGDDQVYIIRDWITKFLHMCAKHDIVVRVLEGTPSHDWKQSRLFPHLNQLTKANCDVAHVTQLSIEYIEKLGIHVLYIPDEWRPTCEQTWEDVQNELRAHGLEKVDYVVMHGAFPHQMPKNLHGKIEMHDPDRYMSICRHYIMIGHVHRFSIYKNILAAGSVERLAQGEEEAKGHLRVKVRANGDNEIKFIENKNAKRYVTISCESLGETEVREKILKIVGKLPRQSYICVKCRRDDPAAAVAIHLSATMVDYNWSIKDSKPSKTASEEFMFNKSTIRKTSIAIDRSNIVSLVMERIRKNPQYDHIALQCHNVLEEIVSE